MFQNWVLLCSPGWPQTPNPPAHPPECWDHSVHGHALFYNAPGISELSTALTSARDVYPLSCAIMPLSSVKSQTNTSESLVQGLSETQSVYLTPGLPATSCRSASSQHPAGLFCGPGRNAHSSPCMASKGNEVAFAGDHGSLFLRSCCLYAPICHDLWNCDPIGPALLRF